MPESAEVSPRGTATKKRWSSPPVKPAFEDFFRAELPRLVVFLVYLRAPGAAAEDIAQDAMVEAYRKWPDIAAPRAWVRTVASRSWGRLVMSQGVPNELPGYSSVAGPLENVLRSEQHREAIAAIQELPFRQRQVMAWTYDGFRWWSTSRLSSDWSGSWTRSSHARQSRWTTREE